MKVATTFACLLVTTFALVNAFSPSSKAILQQKRRSFALYSSPASTKKQSPVDNENSIAKHSAVSALEKLLAKQKAELAETEGLLRQLEQIGNNANNFTSASLSAAASLLSGFDYGFQSRSEGATTKLKGSMPGLQRQYGPPNNVFVLGSQQFMRNFNAILGEYKDEQDNIELTRKQEEYQKQLRQLTLNSTAIWERELKDGPIRAPLLIKIPYLILCWFLDALFEGRYVPSRFFLLETVARMPYFSYITMLQLYETVGFWRRSADIKRIHFAEELNEFRHLLIMESLGGDQKWWVRFVAQHSALAYFVVLCILWTLSPSLSYKFSELLETHAVNTYGQFLDENETLLKKLPPPLAAVEYYCFGSKDPFYAEIQTAAAIEGKELRKPGDNMQNLHDVFSAIQADEGDHVSAMEACLDPDVPLTAPSLERKLVAGVAVVASLVYFLNTGDVMDTDVGGLSTEGGVGGLDADALLAGATAFGKRFLEDEEEQGIAKLAEDMFEVGTVGAALSFLKEAIQDFIKLFSKLL